MKLKDAQSKIKQAKAEALNILKSNKYDIHRAINAFNTKDQHINNFKEEMITAIVFYYMCKHEIKEEVAHRQDMAVNAFDFSGFRNEISN